MTVTRSRSLTDVVRTRTRSCETMPALADAICAAVRTAVPYRFGCLATTDPATGVISWAWKTDDLPLGDEEFAALEYGEPDVNQFPEIIARDVPVGVLSVDTDGHPEDCRRHRDYMAPHFGFTDELRVAFRSQGLTWAVLGIYRAGDDPMFTAAEGHLLGAASASVADIVRHSVFSTRRTPAAAPVSPAVLMIDGADRITHVTAAARERIDDLGGWLNGEFLPTPLAMVCARARRTPELATTRVIGRSGAWLVVRATTFEAGRDVVITVEPAPPADVSSLALAARGLSQREQDVAGLVLRGADTRAIAETLHLSPHTVQDHLKSIFAKLEVNSRREMVQRLVL